MGGILFDNNFIFTSWNLREYSILIRYRLWNEGYRNRFFLDIEIREAKPRSKYYFCINTVRTSNIPQKCCASGWPECLGGGAILPPGSRISTFQKVKISGWKSVIFSHISRSENKIFIVTGTNFTCPCGKSEIIFTQKHKKNKLITIHQI